LWRRLDRRKVDTERLASDVIKHPELLPEILEGLDADKASVRFGCAKVLRIVSEREPSVLYPDLKFFFGLLDSDNQIIKWNGILIIGNLAAVDARGKISRSLDRYLEPISGPDLITAANVVTGAANIAAAKPRLTDRVVDAILKVDRARYRTRQCRMVAAGHAIEALDRLYDKTKRKTQVKRFVNKQLRSSRRATRKKAERFAKRWLGT
jgi:hypothetical protein